MFICCFFIYLFCFLFVLIYFSFMRLFLLLQNIFPLCERTQAKWDIRHLCFDLEIYLLCSLSHHGRVQTGKSEAQLIDIITEWVQGNNFGLVDKTIQEVPSLPLIKQLGIRFKDQRWSIGEVQLEPKRETNFWTDPKLYLPLYVTVKLSPCSTRVWVLGSGQHLLSGRWWPAGSQVVHRTQR